MRRWCSSFLHRLRQLLQNATLRRSSPSRTTLAQSDKLVLEALQLVNPQRDVLKVRLDQRVGLITGLIGTIVQLEQRAHLIQRHIEGTTMADERYPLSVLDAVKAIIPGTSCRLRQQPFPFVVAQRFHRASGTAGQLSNLHLSHLAPSILCLFIYLA